MYIGKTFGFLKGSCRKQNVEKTFRHVISIFRGISFIYLEDYHTYATGLEIFNCA